MWENFPLPNRCIHGMDYTWSFRKNQNQEQIFLFSSFQENCTEMFQMRTGTLIFFLRLLPKDSTSVITYAATRKKLLSRILVWALKFFHSPPNQICMMPTAINIISGKTEPYAALMNRTRLHPVLFF